MYTEQNRGFTVILILGAIVIASIVLQNTIQYYKMQ